MKARLCALVDLAWVVVFAAVGRAGHDEDLGAVGMAATVWPFATGWLVGWALVVLVPAARVRPLGLTAGVLVWLPTVALGMVLRTVSGAGVETSFVVVATVVLGLFLLGWRGVAGLVRRTRRPTDVDVQV